MKARPVFVLLPLVLSCCGQSEASERAERRLAALRARGVPVSVEDLDKRRPARHSKAARELASAALDLSRRLRATDSSVRPAGIARCINDAPRQTWRDLDGFWARAERAGRGGRVAFDASGRVSCGLFGDRPVQLMNRLSVAFRTYVARCAKEGDARRELAATRSIHRLAHAWAPVGWEEQRIRIWMHRDVMKVLRRHLAEGRPPESMKPDETTLPTARGVLDEMRAADITAYADRSPVPRFAGPGAISLEAYLGLFGRIEESVGADTLAHQRAVVAIVDAGSTGVDMHGHEYLTRRTAVVECRAKMRALAIAFACRAYRVKHGTWPSEIGALRLGATAHDPLSGASFALEQTSKGGLRIRSAHERTATLWTTAERSRSTLLFQGFDVVLAP